MIARRDINEYTALRARDSDTPRMRDFCRWTNRIDWWIIHFLAKGFRLLTSGLISLQDNSFELEKSTGRWRYSHHHQCSGDADSDSSQVSHSSLVEAACDGLSSHKGLLHHAIKLGPAESHNW
jgi:hypothetical protein